jgi:fructosamine-3-kinase
LTPHDPTLAKRDLTPHWPLAPQWEARRPFYNLYHLLNHANLFGGHYLSASRRIIGELAA